MGVFGITSFLGEEVGFVETEATADEESLGQGLQQVGGGTQVKQCRARGGGPDAEKSFSLAFILADFPLNRPRSS